MTTTMMSVTRDRLIMQHPVSRRSIVKSHTGKNVDDDGDDYDDGDEDGDANT